MQKQALLIVAFALVFSLIPLVHANGVELDQFDDQLATQLNIGLFPAQVLLTTLIVGLFTFPVLLLSSKPLPPIIMAILSLCFCIAMSWIGYWVLLILTMIIALMFSGRMRDYITGGE